MAGRHARRSRAVTVLSVLLRVLPAALAAVGLTAVSAGTARAANDPMTTVPSRAMRVLHALPRRPVLRTYRVAAGDTLASIAKRACGSSARWPGLWLANKRIVKNPDLIFPRQLLTIACRTVAGFVWQPAAPPRPRYAPVIRTYSPPVATVTGSSGTVGADGASILSDVQLVFGGGTSCAVEILLHESGLSEADVTIANPYSGAYGLPQALPGSKMASAGPDWATNAVTQLRWMLGYVDGVYGGVCNAAAHDLATGTY